MVYQIVMLLLLTGFYAAYFLKQILLRKKGIKTNRLAKGSKPKRTAIIEGFLLVATYGIAVIQYASVFFESYMLPFHFAVPVRIIGLAIAACGVLFFVSAIMVMHDSWRAGVDESQKTEIVTSGIYKWSRNPAFVGFDLLYIGTALVFPNVVMIGASIMALVLFHLQILEEEKFLPSAFGDEYLSYKKSTPRYFLFF